MTTEEDVRALGERLSALPDKADALLELLLCGTMDLQLRNTLDTEVLGPAADRFLWLRTRDTDLHTYVNPDDLASIAEEGWLGEVVKELGSAKTA